MNFRQLTNEEFTNFVNSFPLKSPYQTVPYAFAMTNEGYDAIFLGIVDHNNVVKAASLILIKKEQTYKYAYAPRGFLIDYNNADLINIFTTEIKKFLDRYDVSAVKLNPMIIKNVFDDKHNLIYTNKDYDLYFDKFMRLGYIHLGYNNFFEALKPRFEAIIDLNKSPFLLFKEMRKEFKTKVRSAENNGIRIFRGNETNVDKLYEAIKNRYPRNLQYLKNIYFNFSKQNQMEIYYAKLDTSIYLSNIQNDYIKQESICSELNTLILTKSNNSSKLITKKLDADRLLDGYKEKLVLATNYLRDFPDGIVLSTVMIVKFEQDVFIFMDGYDEKFKTFNSKHLLIWKLIEKYSKLGYARFNLGGLSNVIAEKHRYVGLNDFKMSFGANMYEYMGDLELVTKKSIYTLFRRPVQVKDVSK